RKHSGAQERASMKPPRNTPCLWLLVLILAHAGAAQAEFDTSCIAVGEVAAARLQEEVMARLPAGYESAAEYERAVRRIESDGGMLDPRLFPLLLGLAL